MRAVVSFDASILKWESLNEKYLFRNAINTGNILAKLLDLISSISRLGPLQPYIKMFLHVE